MRICLAQSQSIKGDISYNSSMHLKLIEQAANQAADLIVFPELSLTNYEPTLAEALVLEQEAVVLETFQKHSDHYQITIGIGLPLAKPQGIAISLLFFQPNQPRKSYSKQQLHQDEQPYFVEGTEELLLPIKGHKIAFGICYESLQPAHLAKAVAQGATVYVASVAKESKGMGRAYEYFPVKAAQYQLPIAVVNMVGPADTFVGAGQSAVWDKKGQLLAQLEATTSAVLCVDVEIEA